jgi:hypothetical protein
MSRQAPCPCPLPFTGPLWPSAEPIPFAAVFFEEVMLLAACWALGGHLTVFLCQCTVSSSNLTRSPGAISFEAHTLRSTPMPCQRRW